MVHRHNGVLLSHKKECIWVSFNEVDEPRAYYTEWSKSERERQILYTNACIWNLERLYRRSHVQGSRGDTDIKNTLSDSVGEGEDGAIWEKSTETYTLSYVKQITRTSSMHEEGTHSRCSVTIKRAHMYTYGWFILMYSKNYDNTVK